MKEKENENEEEIETGRERLGEIDWERKTGRDCFTNAIIQLYNTVP